MIEQQELEKRTALVIAAESIDTANTSNTNASTNHQLIQIARIIVILVEVLPEFP